MKQFCNRRILFIYGFLNIYIRTHLHTGLFVEFNGCCKKLCDLFTLLIGYFGAHGEFKWVLTDTKLSRPS